MRRHLPTVLIAVLLGLCAPLWSADHRPVVMSDSGRPITLPTADRIALPSAGPFLTVLAPTATANRTISLPDATTTLGGLSVAQTWSADQTYNARILAANGSDAAPALAFSTDPGWGLYFDGSIQISANGTNMATFDPALSTIVGPLQVNDAITASGDLTGAAVVSVSASGITTRQAATQDAVRLLGRAGGAGSHVATITPPTLSGSITITLPASTSTLATLALTETLSNKTLTSAGAISQTGAVGFVSGTASSFFNGQVNILGENRTLTINNTSNSAGTFATVALRQESVDRFLFRWSLTNDRFEINSRNDDGTSRDFPLIIPRDSSSAIALARPLTITGALTVASDTDATTILGRVRVGSAASDIAYFAHFDHFNTASYALRQQNNGATKVNSAAGQGVILSVNDASIATASSTALTLASGINLAMSGAAAATFGTGAFTVPGPIVSSSSTPSTFAAALDVVSTSTTIGALRMSNNTVDATDKAGRIYTRHYLNSEEAVCVIFSNATSASQVVRVGGGTSAANAATEVSVWVAANTTTLTGTNVATFTSSLATISTPAIFTGSLRVSNTAATITSGTGTPEAAVTAPVGSLFLRTDGGASTTLYVKESGSGNTGWVAK